MFFQVEEFQKPKSRQLCDLTSPKLKWHVSATQKMEQECVQILSSSVQFTIQKKHREVVGVLVLVRSIDSETKLILRQAKPASNSNVFLIRNSARLNHQTTHLKQWKTLMQKVIKKKKMAIRVRWQ